MSLRFVLEHIGTVLSVIAFPMVVSVICGVFWYRHKKHISKCLKLPCHEATIIGFRTRRRNGIAYYFPDYRYVVNGKPYIGKSIYGSSRILFKINDVVHVRGSCYEDPGSMQLDLLLRTNISFWPGMSLISLLISMLFVSVFLYF